MDFEHVPNRTFDDTAPDGRSSALPAQHAPFFKYKLMHLLRGARRDYHSFTFDARNVFITIQKGRLQLMLLRWSDSARLLERDATSRLICVKGIERSGNKNLRDKKRGRVTSLAVIGAPHFAFIYICTI